MSDAYLSEEYRAQLLALHGDESGFGTSGDRYGKEILRAIRALNITSVLDYGCGKGRLKQYLAAAAPTVEVFEYDPAIAGKDVAPDPAEMVVASDVLEHIEPEHLDKVLEHIARLTKKFSWALVTHKPALKFLPDGRNAHLIQEPPEWWAAKLGQFFRIDGVLPMELVNKNPNDVVRTIFILDRKAA